MIQKERINVLNKEETQARRYVHHGVQASQISEYKHVLKEKTGTLVQREVMLGVR